MLHLIIENELEKLKKLDLSYFRGKSYFGDNGIQHYLVFQPIGRYFKKVSPSHHISSWKSKVVSYEIIKTPNTPNNILNPLLCYVFGRAIANFNGSCLKHNKIGYTHGKIVSIHIFYEINKTFPIRSYPTLENCLFDVVKISKHPDMDNYKYCGYGIEFDRKGKFSFGDGFGHKAVIFGVDMSSPVHVDNKKKDISNFGEGPTQGLDYTILTAKRNYSIKFSENKKKLF